MSEKKIVSIGEIQRRIPKDKTVVFTNGCFDIIHKGHVEYLRKARALGDFLIIGVNSDESMEKIKGSKRPIMTFENRSAVLAAFEFVDIIIQFHDQTPIKLINLVKPDILVKGADYQIKDIVGADFVISKGGKVKTIELEKGYSTSQIIQTIKERYCQ
ncbi:MAG: D-glycero-beta-D-manno-heptose 1-phosphate adenylyltransferase [Candidatus Zixiibacteriota bacterium]